MGTVSRWWFYWKCLDGLWQGLVVNLPVTAIMSWVSFQLRSSPYEQGIVGAALALGIMSVINVALILSQRRKPWRTEFPRKPLSKEQLTDLASLLSQIESPPEVHLIRDDWALDCVEISRQLQILLIDIRWRVGPPSAKFYETVRPGIRVRAMASDKILADQIRRALARIFKISIGAEDSGAQHLAWIEIEIGSVLP